MPSNTEPSKREAILQAMLEVVTERGPHDAPLSLVVERSGSIYHQVRARTDACLLSF